MIYIYCEIIITTGSVNIYLLLCRYNKKKRKKLFSLWWELLGFVLNNFPIYHPAVLAIAIMLFITPLVLILQLAFLSMIMKLMEFYIAI